MVLWGLGGVCVPWGGVLVSGNEMKFLKSPLLLFWSEGEAMSE